MLPKLKSTNFEGMELIRPMYLIREKHIINWQTKNELKFIRCACRFTENIENESIDSQRYETKLLIKRWEKENPIIVKNLFKLPSNVNLNKILGYKKDGKYYDFLDKFDEK